MKHKSQKNANNSLTRGKRSKKVHEKDEICFSCHTATTNVSLILKHQFLTILTLLEANVLIASRGLRAHSSHSKMSGVVTGSIKEWNHQCYSSKLPQIKYILLVKAEERWLAI